MKSNDVSEKFIEATGQGARVGGRALTGSFVWGTKHASESKTRASRGKCQETRVERIVQILKNCCLVIANVLIIHGKDI